MNMDTSSVLSAKDISFSHTGKEELFSHLSFTLPKGEFTVLAGSNGCGKSTLLRILAGFLPVSAGEVLLHGSPIHSFSRKRKKPGFVPQELPEAEEMTVRELVLTGLLAGKGLFPFATGKEKAKVQEILEELDLTHLAQRRCASLSGGEFRRAAIGMSLVRSPEILLLDEPCSSLDYGHAQSLMLFLQKMCRKHFLTILMVSHDLILPAKYATNFVLMKKGEIFAEGAPEKVLTKENLEEVYHIPFEVHSSQKNFPVPIPADRETPPQQ